jgi:CRP-like cAMP-binding protein
MPEVTAAEARVNLLLASLADAELDGLLSSMRRTLLPLRLVLYDAGGTVPRVHFPLAGVMSLVTVSKDGSSVEVATVGNEGMIGLPLLLGSGESGNLRAICQVPGSALSVSAHDFRRWLGSDRLPQVLRAYVEYQMIEAAQSVACNRLHPVLERCARWLLLSHDRAGVVEFPLTHEFLAQMLGIRRASVTVAARTLQQAGLVSYKRGRIRILDRMGLEDASCECYGIVLREQARLLPAPPAWVRASGDP